MKSTKSGKQQKNKKKNTVISKQGNSANKREIIKKGQALKHDWPDLKDDERTTRLYELRKLGSSNRRSAKAIGVDDKTVGNYLKKYRPEQNVVPEALPNKAASSGPTNGSAKANTMTVGDQTTQSSKPLVLTNHARAIPFKLNLAALAVEPEPSAPVKIEPAGNRQGIEQTEISRPSLQDPLDAIYERQQEQMAEYRRLNGMGAEVMRNPQPRRN